MSISSVILETEDRVEVGRVSPTHILDVVLPSYDDESFPLLRFLNPWGDTVFNQLQMTQFLKEWRRLYERSPNEKYAELLKKVEELAESCLKTSHLYLRFFGD